MSRSIRHVPVCGFAPSAKKEKLAANRKLRRKAKGLLQVKADILPLKAEVANVRRWRKEPRIYSPTTVAVMPKLGRK